LRLELTGSIGSVYYCLISSLADQPEDVRQRFIGYYTLWRDIHLALEDSPFCPSRQAIEFAEVLDLPEYQQWIQETKDELAAITGS
jgi:hypothetical protein